jgi:quinol monooxygenase YgiN
MFYVINAIKLKQGTRQEFVKLLESNAKGASNEPGCISFNVIQDNSNIDVMWFIETYKEEKDFEAHQLTSHFKQWYPHFKRMVEEFIPNTNAIGRPIYPPINGWPENN